jgi:hypothetical protein
MIVVIDSRFRGNDNARYTASSLFSVDRRSPLYRAIFAVSPFYFRSDLSQISVGAFKTL